MRTFNMSKKLDYVCYDVRGPVLEEAHGRGFNWPLPDHFRIVYLPKMEELKIACDGLGDFLEGYWQA